MPSRMRSGLSRNRRSTSSACIHKPRSSTFIGSYAGVYGDSDNEGSAAFADPAKVISALAISARGWRISVAGRDDFDRLAREAFEQLSYALVGAFCSADIAAHLPVGIEPDQFAGLQIDQTGVALVDA